MKDTRGKPAKITWFIPALALALMLVLLFTAEILDEGQD